MTLGSAPPILFLTTTDLDRCQMFYEVTLGLRCVEHDPSALVFDTSGVMLHINPVESVTPQAHTVLGWQVDDLTETMTALKEAGITFAEFDNVPLDKHSIWTDGDGTQIAWFRDPDGHLLSLTQW